MLRRGTFSGDTIMSVGSSGLGRLIVLASMAAITRIYTEEVYGTWIVIFALSSFFLPLTTLRYEIALVLAPTERLVRGIFRSIFAICLIVVVGILVGTYAAPSSLLGQLSGLKQGQTLWLWAVAPGALMLAVQLLLQSWLMRSKKFLLLNGASLAQAVITMILTIGLPWLIGPTVAAAAFGVFGGLLTSIALMLWYDRNGLLPVMRAPWQGAEMRAALKRYRVYPIYALPYSFSIAATERVLQLTLAATYSVAFVGSYFVARQLLLAPASILSSSIRGVLLAHGARDPSINETRERALRLTNVLVILVAPILAFGVLWMKPLVALLLGTRWAALPDVAWYAMFPAFALIFTGPLDRMFDLVGRQRLAVALQLVSDFLLLLVLFYCVYIGLDAFATIGFVSLTVAVYNCVWLCVVLSSIGAQMRSIIVLFVRFALIFAACAILHSLAHFYLPPTFGLIIGVTIAGLTSAIGLLAYIRALRAGKL